MKKQFNYGTAKDMLDRWQLFDGLRDDDAITSFRIKNAVEDAFRAHREQHKKLTIQRQKLAAEIKYTVDKMKKSKDEAERESVKKTVFRSAPGGGIAMHNLPPDLEEKLAAEYYDTEQQINSLREKTEEVDLPALFTGKMLKKHNLVNGKILATFADVIDQESLDGLFAEPKSEPEPDDKD